MSNLKIALAAWAVTLAGFAVADTAEAGYPYYYHGPYGTYGAFGRMSDQLPPYYAQFPPVYYKAPIIARHYGQSPFAHPPCGCEPTLVEEEVKPATIKNPYIDEKAQAADAKTASLRTSSSSRQPLRIVNPFFVEGDRIAAASAGTQ